MADLSVSGSAGYPVKTKAESLRGTLSEDVAAKVAPSSSNDAPAPAILRTNAAPLV